MLKKSSALLLFISLIFIDQLSKFIIRHFGGFYICNSGIVFGIKVPALAIYLFWIAILILIFYIHKKRLLLNSYFVILFLSGAISNLLDRLIFGCIIDFIDLRFWPVFNPADIFICLGAIIVLIRHSGLDPESSIKKKTQ